MHDVGKIGIPDSILLKPGTLTPAEFDVMKTHTTLGAEILTGSASPLVQMAEQIARCHHERWDGSGYPRWSDGRGDPAGGPNLRSLRRLRRSALATPLQGRLVARTSHDEITRSAGTHLDPSLVDAFLKMRLDGPNHTPDPILGPALHPRGSRPPRVKRPTLTGHRSDTRHAPNDG